MTKEKVGLGCKESVALLSSPPSYRWDGEAVGENDGERGCACACRCIGGGKYTREAGHSVNVRERPREQVRQGGRMTRGRVDRRAWIEVRPVYLLSGTKMG